MLFDPTISFAQQERLEALETAPVAGPQAPLPRAAALPGLSLNQSDLALLPVSSLRHICLSRPALDQALPWALAGGLARAEQEMSYNRRDEVGPPRHIRVCHESTEELMRRFGLSSPSERFDLAWAACLGAQRLGLAHGQSLSPHALLRGFFADQARALSQALADRAERPELPSTPAAPAAQGRLAFGAEFDDPRVSWRHIPAEAIEPSLSPACDLFHQALAKPGFLELALDLVKTSVNCQSKMAFQCGAGELPPTSPAATLLRLSRERGAWSPWLANLCAFPSRNWVGPQTGDPEWGAVNIQAYGPAWPLSAFDPQRALESVQNAARRRPLGPEASVFLQAAGAEALLRELAPERRKTIFGYPSDQALAPLALVSKRLDETRLIELMDLIDAQGPQAWSRWTQGDPPAISLSYQSAEKGGDWLFGLAHNKASPACVARAIARIPGYSASQSRPIARWLKERSEKARAASERAEASALLASFFPLFEAVDLASASESASARASSKRSAKGEAPAAAPKPKRL